MALLQVKCDGTLMKRLDAAVKVEAARRAPVKFSRADYVRVVLHNHLLAQEGEAPAKKGR